MTEESRITVQVVSAWGGLGLQLATELEGCGRWRVVPRTDAVSGVHLRYGPAVATATLRDLCRDLEPLEPELRVEDDLGDVLVLEVGPTEAPDRYNIVLFAEDDELAERVRDSLQALGFRVVRVSHEVAEKSQLLYGGAPAIARQVIRRVLAGHGVKAGEESKWSEEDLDIYLYLVDEALAKLPPRQRHTVRVLCDDPETSELMAAKLAEAGFERVRRMGLDELPDEVEADELRFAAATGPFGKTLDGARLLTLANEVYAQLEVDAERYPLQVEEYEELAVIALPIAACREGLVPTYDGPFPDRFRVRLYTDAPGRVADLLARLQTMGFARVEVVDGGSLPGEIAGFELRLGAAAKFPSIADPLRQHVEETMRALGAGPDLELRVEKALSDDDPDIWVVVPVEGVADGSLAARLRSPGRFACTIRCRDTDDLAPTLERRLRGWGFRSLSIDPEFFMADNRSVEIAYGGASAELIERLRDELTEMVDVTPTAKKSWGSSDTDIWISVGSEVRRRGGAGASTGEVADSGDLDLGAWVAGPRHDLSEHPAPFVEIGTDRVRVGTVELERWPGPPHPLAPAPELFHHYCLDRSTAETLEHLATCVALREAALLEGETSTSKTSSIQYLASLLGQPVVRLNLNGQTDTGDLIGRWVPRSLGEELPFSAQELGEASTLLESETRLILERATREGRPLNRVEIQQIVANERMRSHPWSWQDGLVVQAVRNGWWAILDEVNLAEPQILERLNSLLEREPQLVLTEHDGSVFGPGGTPIHPRFRIFATMNPAEYAGRTALSPAYRNRWRGYRIVPNPTEHDYEDMLRCTVFGTQPEVRVLGQTWRGLDDGPAPHGVLAGVRGVDDLLHALARFQVALENASGQRLGSRAQIGVRRKERYVFTRRDLLSVMDYLASPLSEGAAGSARAFKGALLRYYLQRVASEEDRRLVADLLNAAGIGPGTWTLEVGTPEAEVEGEASLEDLIHQLEEEAEELEGTDPDLEVDTDATLETIAEELRALLVSFKATGTLHPRAIALRDAVKDRFERPDSEALRDFDKAVKAGDVDKVRQAVRGGLPTDRPWLLAGLVTLRELGYPEGHLMKLVSVLCDREAGG